MIPEHARDTAMEQADQAGREDDRSFQELFEDEAPHYSEREQKLLELCGYLFAHVPRQYTDYATEQMRDIANTPDKMRLALLEVKNRTRDSEYGTLLHFLNTTATNALK